MENLAEALGYTELLLAMFDFPYKNRSQLKLLLETMFFGYQAPAMQQMTVFTAPPNNTRISRYVHRKNLPVAIFY